MSRLFEELAWHPTEMGALSLRRRREPRLGVDIHEIMLGEEFLMSSLFTEAEEALARLALAELPAEPVDVAIGGLGLGYSARAALQDERVRSLIVVESLGEVIAWHREGLLPLGPELTGDQRCRLVHGDFFTMAAGHGFHPDRPGRKFHAVVVDIDHTPRKTLDSRHADFYSAAGLESLARHLHPGGVFALWSDDPPEDDFMAMLSAALAEARAEVVSFHNPLRDRPAANTVYIGRKPAG